MRCGRSGGMDGGNGELEARGRAWLGIRREDAVNSVEWDRNVAMKKTAEDEQK